MRILNKNTQFPFKGKPNLGKKKIAKALKILGVVANFKKSISEHPHRC